MTDLTKRRYGHRDGIQSSTESSALAKAYWIVSLPMPASWRHRSSMTREAYESQLPPITWDIFSSQHGCGRACDVRALPVSLLSRAVHIALLTRHVSLEDMQAAGFRDRRATYLRGLLRSSNDRTRSGHDRLVRRQFLTLKCRGRLLRGLRQRN